MDGNLTRATAAIPGSRPAGTGPARGVRVHLVALALLALLPAWGLAGYAA